MPHQYRIKPVSPTPTKTSLIEREPKNYHLFRFFLLLLLMLCAASSVLRLGSSSSPPPSSFLVHQASDNSFVAESSKDVESLRTHISSKDQNHLQVCEERSGATSVSCSALIDGEMEAVNIAEEKGVLCCDRSHYRTDVCYMKGDIRTDSLSSSISIYGEQVKGASETIRPYTRKWETGIMNTIDEITLRPMRTSTNTSLSKACDVHHAVPGFVFSTGGYTGNVYHEFNDGLIPLYITLQRFHGEVLLVVLEYHSWWATKYRSVVKKLSNYKMVDFSKDGRVHCFPEMIVGLKIHGELTIDPQLMPNGKGIRDFQELLHQGFGNTQSKQPHLPAALRLPSSNPHVQHVPPSVTVTVTVTGARPKIAIFIRNKSRVLLNLKEVMRICQRIGFQVQILNPRRTTQLSEIYEALNSADAMLAVHGAAMTHFLFMRPSTVLIQIVPLGLDWAAKEYYGEPARRLGLEYMPYKIVPEESSLVKEYDRRDPVIVDPKAITKKGWSETKRIYLEKQNVRVNIRRFSKLLVKAHSHIRSLHPS